MQEDGARRSLTTIVMADIVGFSRLMGEDEPGTLRRLRAYRAELVDPLIARHVGRLVDAAGDSLLIEFSSVVDAVEAAIALQQGLARANAALAPGKRLEYRIGVNIGDVIVQNRALYGDGVNVAARLQALAAPGGLCLSRAAFEQIRGKIDVAFDDLGPHTVKNIARPIEVFALAPAAIAVLPESAAAEPRRRAPMRKWRAALVAVAVLGGAAIGAYLYLHLRGPNDLEFSAKLGKALQQREPGLGDGLRTRLVADYLALRPHRAFAFAPVAASHWWTGDWPGGLTAEEKVLERCQIRFGEPCALAAVDDKLVSSASASPHDMARVAYSGKFDPQQIPGLRRNISTRADVAGYLQAAGPKAAAIHPRGVLAISTGAPTQHMAEVRALKLCNDDDGARDIDGVCFLYAVGDDVVLSKRLTAPITAK